MKIQDLFKVDQRCKFCRQIRKSRRKRVQCQSTALGLAYLIAASLENVPRPEAKLATMQLNQMTSGDVIEVPYTVKEVA
jgi:hypothetical protein